MKEYINRDLTKKYSLIREQIATAGEWSAGGEMESVISPDQPSTALDWRNAGLFEPNTKDEEKLTQVALNELQQIFNTFDKNLKDWQHKHTNIGASDTVSREQVAQFVARSILGLKKLDHHEEQAN